MTVFQLSNNAVSTVSDNPLSDTATSLLVGAGDGALFPSTGTFIITIWDYETYSTPGEDPEMEICWCTSRTEDYLAITRGKESTTSVSHAYGSKVALLITAGYFEDSTHGINIHLPSIDEKAALEAASSPSGTNAFVTVSVLSSHISGTSNPHNVTAEQIGLGDVINGAQILASDLITSITGTEDGKVASESAIVAYVASQISSAGLSNYMPLAGGTFDGDVDFDTHSILNLLNIGMSGGINLNSTGSVYNAGYVGLYYSGPTLTGNVNLQIGSGYDGESHDLFIPGGSGEPGDVLISDGGDIDGHVSLEYGGHDNVRGSGINSHDDIDNHISSMEKHLSQAQYDAMKFDHTVPEILHPENSDRVLVWSERRQEWCSALVGTLRSW
jgi:hypothetical protein